MALSMEDRQEVEAIVTSIMHLQNINLDLLQQQWKKFKESPEARLAALEVRTGGLEREVSELKTEIKELRTEVNKKFDEINKKFDELNKTLLRLHESMNAQVWKFLGGLGVILILLRLAGAIFPSLP